MDRLLIVKHEPIGQPRHRVTTIGGFARMFLPKEHPVHGFKKAIRTEFGAKAPLSGPVFLDVTAWFSRPKSEIRKIKPMPAYPHAKKPDADNILKAIMDALNGYAWKDDAQVYSVRIDKFVSDGTQGGQVEILIGDHSK
jgi:Holliday junction resolvase RusA-like endonuclease